MVDEHYYEKPEWFLNNLQRHDSYDRTKSRVYLGEYAAHDKGRVNTLRSALAEAAYLTSLERNGDIVRLVSYAPLLAKQGRTQWRPDMIYFNNTNLLRSANYFVQQMFGQNAGDVYLPASVAPAAASLAFSCVQDTKSGDVILKLVNVASNSVSAQVNLEGIARIKSATRTVLAGAPTGSNTFEQPGVVAPVTDKLLAAKTFPCELPANSLTVIRLRTK